MAKRSLARRVRDLEGSGGPEAGFGSSPHYDLVGQEARQDIEESRTRGEEQLYRIDIDGTVRTVAGRIIREYADLIRALDERVEELERKIQRPRSGR